MDDFIPTMKSLDSDKKAEKSSNDQACAGDNNGFFTDNAKIDFSQVKVEPSFLVFMRTTNQKN